MGLRFGFLMGATSECLMATQTDRLLILAAAGTFGRNDPLDTLQISSTIAFNGGVGKTITTDENFSQTGASTFSTGTSTFTHNGATVFASVATTASGTSSFDLSGGSGVFKTSTGAVTIGSGAVTISGATTFTASGNALTVNNNAIISGDLTVTGTTFSTSAEIVNINDNHLYLNNGYTTDAAQTGGLVINYDPTTTTTTVAAGGFTAGVAATSNPTVITVGASTFSASDIIQISGAAVAENNGLFEVLTHAAGTLTIRGVGTTACVEDFTQNQFTTSTTVQGSIFKVAVSVLRSGTDGNWEVGKGSATGITFSDLVTSSSVTLQTAYESGATIALSDTEGDLIITTDETGTVANFTVARSGGGNYLSTDATNDTLILGGTTVLLSNLVKDNTTGAFLVKEGTNTYISVDTNDAAEILTLGSSGANATVNVNSGTGTLNIGSTASARAVNVGTGGAVQTVIVGSGNSTSVTTVDCGTAGLSLGTTANAHTVTIGSTTTTAGVTIQGGTSGVSVGANAIAQTVTIGNTTTTSAVTIDAGTGTIGIGSGAQARSINIGDGAAVQTMNIGTGAAANLVTVGTTNTSATLNLKGGTGGVNVTVADNTAAALVIQEAATAYLTIVTTNSFEEIKSSKFVNISSGAGYRFTASEAINTNDIVCILQGNTSGKIAQADADGTNRKTVLGIAGSAAAADGDTVQVISVAGTVFAMKMTAAPATTDIGKVVYLSATAGQGTLTAPTASGTDVYRVGILATADGASTTPNVVFQPAFIASNP